MTTLPISVTMLVKNSATYLEEVLQSLQAFDEIIILDNGSTDNTMDIARQFANVRLYEHPFIGFGPMKNLAASYATHEWILNVDSDEVFPQTLIQEIQQLPLDDLNKVYAFNRINHYRGKPIKVCGWYPDYVKRMYAKSKVQFNAKQVHESLEIPSDVKVHTLNNPFLHYSFAGADDLIKKMQQYTRLFAEQQKYQKSASVLTAVGHGISAFFKNYFLKRGILAGADGFVISFANACGSYYKYVKLAEANQALTTSLIITTYNRADALEAVLVSVLKQTTLPNEVIVADDGSGESTEAIIKKYQAIFPVPLKHAWQVDNGFRLALSRNRAMAMASQEYIIIIDGDMVLHPQFVADHIAMAQKNHFIQGGRVVLTEEKTQDVLRTPERYHDFKWYEKGLEKRLEKRFTSIRLPFLRTLLASKKTQELDGIRGCNMAFFKEDAERINGFNNDFIGWGREDSEFVARFFNAGGKRKNCKFGAIAYHLYHHEAARNALPQNDALLQQAKQGTTFYPNGLAQADKTE